jgi:hypothetical protein
MLIETQETIIAALIAAPPVFRYVDGWQGEIEDLVRQVGKLPSAHVAMGEIDFGEEPTAMGTLLSLDDSVWNVIITASNVRDRKSGAVECYQLIEAVVNRLKGLQVINGWLWPVNAKLLYAKNGLSIYGVSFRLETEQ